MIIVILTMLVLQLVMVLKNFSWTSLILVLLCWMYLCCLWGVLHIFWIWLFKMGYLLLVMVLKRFMVVWLIGLDHQKRGRNLMFNACQLYVQCTKELVLDCKTRWNLTYLMFSLLLCFINMFSLVWLNVKHLILVYHLIIGR